MEREGRETSWLRKLVGEVRGSPEGLIQILLASSPEAIKKRIIGSPAYPTVVETIDLQPRLHQLLESSKSEAPIYQILGRLVEVSITESRRKQFGQYFTPPSVAREAVRRLTLREGDVIVDAGSGTGAFPWEIKRHLGSGASMVDYLGVEIDPMLALCGAVTLEWSNAPRDWKILFRNFLRVDKRLLNEIGLGEASVVISNPPFTRHHLISDPKVAATQIGLSTGLRLSRFSGVHSFFLAHATTLLKRGGRMEFLLPIGMDHVEYGHSILGQLSKEFRYEVRPLNSEMKLFVFREESGKYRRSRLEQNEIVSKPHNVRLLQFAKVHRGVSTGANNFFVLSDIKKASMKIRSGKFLIKVTPTRVGFRHETYSVIDWSDDLESGKACWLLHIPPQIPYDSLPAPIRNYLREGEVGGIPEKYTCAHRLPWYSVRLTNPPDLIFTHISRHPRFVCNQAGVRILNNLLGVYFDKRLALADEDERALAEAMNFDLEDWIRRGDQTGSPVGRMYGGGLLKFEPGDVSRMPLSEKTLNLVKRKTVSLFDYTWE